VKYGTVFILIGNLIPSEPTYAFKRRECVMLMNSLGVSDKPTPIWGILSTVLAPLGLLLVVCFASGARWGAVHSRAVIVFAQYLLLALLGSGLVSGIARVLKREQPRWLSVAGLILTICITTVIALFFYSLDD
jgi:hypothetical protein